MLGMQTRKKKTPGIMRDILAINVKALMEREFVDEPNMPKALAKRAGLSLSSVQRTLSAETGASVDTIEALGLALPAAPPGARRYQPPDRRRRYRSRASPLRQSPRRLSPPEEKPEKGLTPP